MVDIELAGTRIISFLIHELVKAVCNPDLNYSRLLTAKVPEQYEVDSPGLYGKLRLCLTTSQA